MHGARHVAGRELRSGPDVDDDRRGVPVDVGKELLRLDIHAWMVADVPRNLHWARQPCRANSNARATRRIVVTQAPEFRLWTIDLRVSRRRSPRSPAN